jgi:hypothetical protein
MTTNTNREDAIARIMARAQELADRDAAAAQAVIDRKRKKKETKKAWRLANPEKAQEAQRKKQAKRDAWRREKYATDPVYAEAVRQKRREEYAAKRERLGADVYNAIQRAAVQARKARNPEAFRAKDREYQKQRRAKERAAAVKHWLTTEPTGKSGEMTNS